MVENSTYTSVYWKNHAMYFVLSAVTVGAQKEYRSAFAALAEALP